MPWACRLSRAGAGVLEHPSAAHGEHVHLNFLFGLLLMDVHDAALLGEPALAYSLLSCGVLSLHRRVPWFTCRARCCTMLPLFWARRSCCWWCFYGGRRLIPGMDLVPAGRLQQRAAVAASADWLLLAPQQRRRRPRAKSRPSRAQGFMPASAMVGSPRCTENAITGGLRVRLVVAMHLVLTCFGILVARLSYLQVYRYAAFHARRPRKPRIALVPAPPSRGLIFDRNGVLLAEDVSYAGTLAQAHRQARRNGRRAGRDKHPRATARPASGACWKRNSDSVPLKCA